MSQKNLSSMATDVISTYGITATNVINTYRFGGERVDSAEVEVGLDTERVFLELAEAFLLGGVEVFESGGINR